MVLDLFHPLIRQWFEQRFDAPTEPQTEGWPHIASGRNTLIAAPTGSGKTLAAFLVCLDRLLRQWMDNRLVDEMQVVYVSPLKALSNDIERNLQQPLSEIGRLAEEAGLERLPIRAAVRTGDTPASQRQAMMRRPPHILVTTPESLYLLLTAERGRERLRTVKTVIVDEIHALARDKRGSHLALSLERLEAVCEQPPVRIGLSATQRPIDQIARFLVGTPRRKKNASRRTVQQHLTFIDEGTAEQTEEKASAIAPAEDSFRDTDDHDSEVNCKIIDGGHVRDLDLQVEVPPSELTAVCSIEQWTETYDRLLELINSHRSTLIFVNTRRFAERVAHNLRELLGEEAVAAHHGSLSRDIRLSAEQRLKAGELKAIVATASLEMGIDIGYIDLVCQIGSPRAIATFLQRVGRSGHTLGTTPKGRLFPLTRDELLECLALVRAVRKGELDRIEIPEKPLDILAQQIIAETACQQWDERELFDLFRQAWPYRDLTREEFETIVNMVSEGVSPKSRRGAYLHRDQINGQVRARRGARIAAVTSGGAIPETAEYRVVTEDEKTFVGTLDEDFAIESMSGDVFLLGNTSWRIRYVRGGEVVVNDAHGAPPTIPFWIGEAPGRTIELSHEISRLRQDIAVQFESPANEQNETEADSGSDGEDWLVEECGAGDWAARQATRYVEAQHAAIGLVPTKDRIVFERFFDESGGMQLVIHAPLGARINRAWGLAMRKRFCRSFDFELQAAATDDGIVLSLGPQHSVPIEDLFKILRTDNGRYLLEQALLAAPMLQVRWRWNVTRSLAVLRRNGGKKVPPYLQRMQADDLLADAFPETVGCLENHHGDVEIPDHPLVAQTMHDCLHEAMDVDRWLEVLGDIEAGKIELVARDTREPSPFSHELLNANPYAFLDDAPLEERRSRAVATRRSLSVEAFQDLAKLDPEAIELVRRQAWPTVRDADELHDALMSLVLVHEDEARDWSPYFEELVADGRAARLALAAGETPRHWIAAERWPLIRSVYEPAVCEPPVELPAALNQDYDRSKGWVDLARGRMQHGGPITAASLAELLRLEVNQVESSLEALEGEGVVLRGHFTCSPTHQTSDSLVKEFCDRRLLARIHRLTLDGLRRQIEPVEPCDFIRFLVLHHRVGGDVAWGGPVGVREAISQLQGLELPAGAWEKRVLAARIGDYDSKWLDHLFLSGELTWGRLQPPRAANKQGPTMASLTRTVPISLLLREDLPWLLPQSNENTEEKEDEETSGSPPLRSNAQLVLEALHARGALFLQELKACTQVLPTHLEEALRELAARGLVTSDTFAAVRAIVSGENKSTGRRSQRRKKPQQTAAAVGRWSCFPPIHEAPSREDYLDRWCHQLLRRWGVVFRDLLSRESAAPAWWELLRRLRQMELRGEVRGGRFVAGVAGEQFGTEEAVRKLREIRDTPPDGGWVVLPAADPLNLTGILDDLPRVPATNTNSIILQDGRCVAHKQVADTTFLIEVTPTVKAEMHRALHTGRRSPVMDASFDGSVLPSLTLPEGQS